MTEYRATFLGDLIYSKGWDDSPFLHGLKIKAASVSVANDKLDELLAKVKLRSDGCFWTAIINDHEIFAHVWRQGDIATINLTTLRIEAETREDALDEVRKILNQITLEEIK